jgi:hypothetical protein
MSTPKDALERWMREEIELLEWENRELKKLLHGEPIMPDAARDPETPAEWQEAVDGAHFLRCLADCQMYGLITGAENVNIERCDEILDRGAKLGYKPNLQLKEMLSAK